MKLTKKYAIWFFKNEGGSQAIWNFLENSPVLVTQSVPNILFIEYYFPAVDIDFTNLFNILTGSTVFWATMCLGRRFLQFKLNKKMNKGINLLVRKVNTAKEAPDHPIRSVWEKRRRSHWSAESS